MDLPSRGTDGAEGEVKSAVDDSEVLRQAREGKLSLFLSLLKVIDQQHREHLSGEGNETADNDSCKKDAAVSNRQLLRSCALTVQPGLVPGALDAKEVVMAALHFLSSSWQPHHLSRKASSYPSSSAQSGAGMKSALHSPIGPNQPRREDPARVLMLNRRFGTANCSCL